MLFILSLIATRTVTIGGPHRLGVSLKLVTVTAILGLLLAQSVLSPVAVAAALAAILAALVLADHALVAHSEPPALT